MAAAESAARLHALTAHMGGHAWQAVVRENPRPRHGRYAVEYCRYRSSLIRLWRSVSQSEEVFHKLLKSVSQSIYINASHLGLI